MSKGNPNPSPATRFSAAQQPKNGQHGKSSYSQAVEWQRRLNEAAMKEGVTPHALAMLSRAWKEQEELKRRMRGLPDPKPYDVAAAQEEKRRQRSATEFMGPWEAEPDGTLIPSGPKEACGHDGAENPKGPQGPTPAPAPISKNPTSSAPPVAPPPSEASAFSAEALARGLKPW